MGVMIEAVYDGQLMCTARHVPSAAVLRTEAPVDNGGQGRQFSPTDLVAAAFATCVLTIMGLYAQREGLALAGTAVQIDKSMTTVPPRRIAALAVRITLPPALALSAEQREKLAATVRACPVKQSLHPDVVIDVAWQ
ncbi:MAG TPA: OsmC family protein [bacterium]|nr:OsmC family protein [bacterium]